MNFYENCRNRRHRLYRMPHDYRTRPMNRFRFILFSLVCSTLSEPSFFPTMQFVEWIHRMYLLKRFFSCSCLGKVSTKRSDFFVEKVSCVESFMNFE